MEYDNLILCDHLEKKNTKLKLFYYEKNIFGHVLYYGFMVVYR